MIEHKCAILQKWYPSDEELKLGELLFVPNNYTILDSSFQIKCQFSSFHIDHHFYSLSKLNQTTPKGIKTLKNFDVSKVGVRKDNFTLKYDEYYQYSQRYHRNLDPFTHTNQSSPSKGTTNESWLPKISLSPTVPPFSFLDNPTNILVLLKDKSYSTCILKSN